MFRFMQYRAGQLLLIVLLWAVTSLPNLGGSTLWDIDEGLNAEAAREMLASGNWIVPTFNYELRSAKPVLLYWLQAAAYQTFGVHETAARLPSALAVLLTALAVWGLGRRLFDAGTALLAAVILVTCAGVQGAAHFANPDALLLAFTTLALAFFWLSYDGAAAWLVASAAACGLAVLAKGPVGLALPGAVVLLFLLWQRQPRRLFGLYFWEGVLVFLLVAAPWYVWVSVETKGQWLREFWFAHHLNRVATPMENHSGSPLYYLVVLCVGLVPWAIFAGPTGWYAWRESRRAGTAGFDREAAAARFLVCWFAVFFVFFSVVRTKLPNYILPLYPAAALLLARLVERWRRGEVELPGWVMRLAMTTLGLIGLGTAAGVLVAGGAVAVPALRGRVYPGLLPWAWIGGLLFVTAVVGYWLVVRERRGAAIGLLATAAAVFVTAVTAGALPEMNPHKPSVALAQALPDDQLEHDIRIGACDYFQPSLVFYCQREVKKLYGGGAGVAFLHSPLPAYLIVRGDTWEEIRGKVPPGARVLTRQRDLYINQDVVLVANQPAVSRQVVSGR